MILNSGTRADFWAGHLGARGWEESVMCMAFMALFLMVTSYQPALRNTEQWTEKVSK